MSTTNPFAAFPKFLDMLTDDSCPRCYLCGDIADRRATLSGDYLNFVPGEHDVCAQCFGECADMGEVSQFTTDELARIETADCDHADAIAAIVSDYDNELQTRAMARALTADFLTIDGVAQ
jgi:hypothetical protein